MHFTDQRDYAIRFECGERGLSALALARPTHFVIVDVLSFSTCVVVAVERGAEIVPYRWKDALAEDYAREHGALLAGGTGSPYSLSVESLAEIAPGTRLVLPSPNGSTLAHLAAGSGEVLAGCLRNRSALSAFLNQQQGPFAIIAAGERWADGTLRPCFEDQVGAGAIIAGLLGSRSPEAASAVAAFEAVADQLSAAVAACSSGRELIEKGYPRNVELAAALDASDCLPVLRDGRFVRGE
ncbi:MAG: 2-phosphosulfolactate phosphatase [Deltaproteobacteria bacterium]